jgi:hypothetical protein
MLCTAHQIFPVDQLRKNEKGDERCIEYFGGKPERRRTLGRPRSRCVDNIEMDLQELISRAWTGLFWLRIGTGECGNEHSGPV